MNSKLNILIVEDELLIAEMLKEILLEMGHCVIAVARNFKSTFEIFNLHKNIDFIFLDINLNDALSGIDIAEKLNKDFKIPFIFLTSYSDPKTIQDAVACKPQSYLIKPFTKSDIFVTLEIFKSRNFDDNKATEIKDGHYLVKIKHNDILWIKSENVYLEIKTLGKTYLVRSSFENFLQKLNDDNFVKVHRSYVVNLNHVSAVNRVFIIVQNEKIPISRLHHEDLVAKYLK